MPSWPEKPRLIGKSIPRIDGLAKASGKIKYPSDMRPEGTLFGVMLYSPHPHAKVTSIDTAAAEKMPGVKGVVVIAKAGATLRYHGDDIAGVAAETEEQARDAVRAIKVDYEILPHVVTEEDAVKPDAPKIVPSGNARKGRAQTTGDPEAAFKEADAVVEAEYSAPVITHVCLEPHGLTARWDRDDAITAWASTQAVGATAGELAGRFSIPVTNVTVLTEVMGGGFGSKFGADVWGLTAAELSKKAGGRPVKMFLDRIQEHLAGGNRPSAAGKVKIAGKKDGTVTAVVATTSGTGGARGGSNFPFPYVYAIKNVSREHTEIFVNGGGARAMRAPGHPQGCLIMEAAMDDLADKLGIDPLEMRLKNLNDGDKVVDANGKPTISRAGIYREQVPIGAKLIGWENRKPRGQNGKGPIKRGYGMALHQWGGGGTAVNKVTCTISPDGSVELKTATQDIGTGARTILAIIAAEILGLEVKDVISNIGNSTFPPGQGSGGSTTSPSMAPPAFNAVSKARDEFLARVGKAINEEPADLTLQDGKLDVKGKAVMSWKDACRKLGMMGVSVTEGFAEGLASGGVAGCQFADVTVDIETGVVKLNKIVAVQDSGLILDMLTWRSQVYGGVIGGLNYGLFEERVMDPGSGLMLNPDMELYKLAGLSDIPEIVVHAHDTPEMRARGVIGVGEPPTISTAAAIGNAVTNAVGVRVNKFPMSPMNVLNALNAASNKEGKA
ncbi:MAG: xdhA 1 [Planctomycetota bacterium]|nr:xdhA 1 [Planctomycetota bacterium]